MDRVIVFGTIDGGSIPSRRTFKGVGRSASWRTLKRLKLYCTLIFWIKLLMSFFTYVLKNSQTNKIYIGQTINLKSRIDRHNNLLKNKNSSFTHKNKKDGEWLLIYSEEFTERKLAVKREKELKSYRGREFIKGL